MNKTNITPDAKIHLLINTQTAATASSAKSIYMLSHIIAVTSAPHPTWERSTSAWVTLSPAIVLNVALLPFIHFPIIVFFIPLHI